MEVLLPKELLSPSIDASKKRISSMTAELTAEARPHCRSAPKKEERPTQWRQLAEIVRVENMVLGYSDIVNSFKTALLPFSANLTNIG